MGTAIFFLIYFGSELPLEEKNYILVMVELEAAVRTNSFILHKIKAK